jgi:hypothetical protein
MRTVPELSSRIDPQWGSLNVKGSALVVGFTSLGTVLLVSRSNRGLKYDGVAQLMDIRSPSAATKTWRFQIPGLLDIREGCVSPDLKQASWIAVYNLEPGANVLPESAKIAAGIWISASTGAPFAKVATIDLPGVTMADFLYSIHPLPLPRQLQWVPGGHKLSYLWNSRLWTVEVP